MNDWKGIGRVTREIKCSYTNTTNRAYARFTLAIDRPKKGSGADFIPCLVWDQQAKTMEKYVKKGELIAFSGRIQSGSYEKHGETFYSLEVVGNFEFVTPKSVKDSLNNAEHAQENQEKSTASTNEHEQQNSEHQEEIPDGFEAIDEEVPF